MAITGKEQIRDAFCDLCAIVNKLVIAAPTLITMSDGGVNKPQRDVESTTARLIL
jgi:hypothetical protein